MGANKNSARWGMMLMPYTSISSRYYPYKNMIISTARGNGLYYQCDHIPKMLSLPLSLSLSLSLSFSLSVSLSVVDREAFSSYFWLLFIRKPRM
jgi:hypothetical protein